MTAQKIRPAPLAESGRAEVVGIKSNSASKPNQANEQATAPQSKWREKYRVHPCADVFPMMSDEELDALAGDILVNGLRESIKIRGDLLLDGRNQLEAAERVGVEIGRGGRDIEHLPAVDPVRFIISANINRRHLTKAQRADLIVAIHKAAAEEANRQNKPRKDCEVSRGGRGKVDEFKAAVVESGKAEKISKRTMESALARADGKKPKLKPTRLKPTLEKHLGLDAARRFYIDKIWSEPDIDLDAEQKIIIEALREIAGKRAMQSEAGNGDDLEIPACLVRKQASTLTQDGRSEGDLDDREEAI